MEMNPTARKSGGALPIENDNPRARNAFIPEYMDQLIRQLNAGGLAK